MNKQKTIKFLKGAGIAAAGAVLAYTTQVIIPDLQGAGLVTVAAIGSMIVNFGRLLLAKIDDDPNT